MVCLLVAGMAALFLPAAPLVAASPRAELLRLVPEDVGFCLLIEDLRGHGNALANSPFLRQFLTSTVGSKVMHAEETQKLSFIDAFLEQNFHLTATQLRDEILGDALVLAYRPGPVQQPEQEQGLLLVRARNPKLLADLIQRLNELQKSAGDLQELEERSYHALKYYRRDEKKGIKRGDTFYYLHGPVLAFANQEQLLHQVMELDLRAPSEEESPVGRQFELMGVVKPLAALWINPRAFEPALQQKAAAAEGAQAASLKTLLVYWKALEGIAISVTLQEDFGLSLAVRARTDQLPASARRFLSTAARRTDLWDSVPKNAMLAGAGRTDVAALVEVLGEFMAEETRKSVQTAVEGSVGAIFGKDLVKDVLPELGPDWMFYAAPAPADDPNWFPHCVAAVRVGPGKGDMPAGLTLWNALNSLATLAVFHWNGGHPGAFRLNSTLQDKVEVKYLVNDESFPPGLQPALAWKAGHLVLASSPRAILAFNPAAPRADTAPRAEVPLLRLSLRDLTRFIKERKEALTPYISKKNHLEPEVVAQGLTTFINALELFDTVEIIQRGDPGRVILSLRIKTTQPLK
jgi:hypothetical protein